MRRSRRGWYGLGAGRGGAARMPRMLGGAGGVGNGETGGRRTGKAGSGRGVRRERAAPVIPRCRGRFAPQRGAGGCQAERVPAERARRRGRRWKAGEIAARSGTVGIEPERGLVRGARLRRTAGAVPCPAEVVERARVLRGQ